MLVFDDFLSEFLTTCVNVVSQLSDFFSPMLSFSELWERYGGLGERPGGLREHQEAYGKKSLPQFSPKS